MAGAGFKTFNTGDVLTASDVNTYLMQQTVMVFADASARSTALGANVAEGMLSYLKDTNAVEVYNGSSWVSSDDPNAIQNTIVDAKGDLISATAADTPARLAVGTDGQVLTADSSTATGLKWASASTATSLGFTAGKNKIINGDFYWNQRNFTSVTTSDAYGFDRFQIRHNTTVTYTPQTFTAGTAPVAGYEGKNFAQIATTTSSAAGEYSIFGQQIEDVRMLAGQTVTVSFWAKASSGTPKVGVEFEQNWNGSANTTGTGQSITLSTSWTRYTATITLGGASGKTIGSASSTYLNFWLSAGSTFNTRSGSIGNQTATIQFWGIQVEFGSTATSFQTATGTIQGELAACQRYYWRMTGASGVFLLPYCGTAAGTTSAVFGYKTPVTMRIAPSSIDFASTQATDASANYALSNLAINNISSADVAYITATASGLTTFRPLAITSSGAAGYIGLSAEL